MRLLQKPFLYTLASIVLGVGPLAIIFASSLLHAKGAEAALLIAIGFSPVWAGMFLLSYLLLDSSKRRSQGEGL